MLLYLFKMALLMCRRCLRNVEVCDNRVNRRPVDKFIMRLARDFITFALDDLLPIWPAVRDVAHVSWPDNVPMQRAFQVHEHELAGQENAHHDNPDFKPLFFVHLLS